jgi:hypothetical protein
MLSLPQSTFTFPSLTNQGDTYRIEEPDNRGNKQKEEEEEE